MFRLNPALDRAALAQEHRAARRVQITALLDGDGAERLRGELRSREDWNQIVNSGGKMSDLSRPARAAVPRSSWTHWPRRYSGVRGKAFSIVPKRSESDAEPNG